MDESLTTPIIRERKWISKEEAKEMWPENKKEIKPVCDICKEYTCCICRFKSSPIGKWKYECYICGIKSYGDGELIKSCDCNH